MYGYVNDLPLMVGDYLGLKKCPLSLYSRGDSLTKSFRREITKGDDYIWAYSIQRFNTVKLKKKMCHTGCSCMDEVKIYDHGTVSNLPNGGGRKGEQGFGYI